jgi:hypothetical protein
MAAVATDDLETELAVAADFLADHGFGGAADAVRVLYPRLPRSVMVMRRIFMSLCNPSADLSGWELEAPFVGRPPVRVPVVEVVRSVVEDRGDHRTLGLSLQAAPLPIPPGEQSVFADIGVVYGGEVLLLRGLQGGQAQLHPGDMIDMTYSMTLEDFLLPRDIVEAFVPDQLPDPLPNEA